MTRQPSPLTRGRAPDHPPPAECAVCPPRARGSRPAGMCRRLRPLPGLRFTGGRAGRRGAHARASRCRTAASGTSQGARLSVGPSAVRRRRWPRAKAGDAGKRRPGPLWLSLPHGSRHTVQAAGGRADSRLGSWLHAGRAAPGLRSAGRYAAGGPNRPSGASESLDGWTRIVT
jgi:hypothetical protein